MNSNNEIFEDIVTRQLQSLRLDASFRQDVIKDLNKLEKILVDRVSESEIGDSYTAKRLNELLKSVRNSIKDVYFVVNEDLEQKLTEYVTLESQQTNKILDNVLELDSVVLPINKINKIYSKTLIQGAPSSEWWERQSVKIQQLFEDNIRQGLLLGETTQQLVQRVRGTKAFNYTNGIMNVARNDAEALVRSSVQSVSNAARFETMESNLDIIEKYRYVSTLDSRTTDQCIARDGLEWYAATKESIGHSIAFQIPPIHWNCRSTIIPVTIGSDLNSEAKRASPDGPVSAKTTFKDFLDGKSKAFQEETLGKGKAQLYREGKITIRQLLDQSGNPLTLAELKQKYNN